jgi:hypothetical protein
MQLYILTYLHVLHTYTRGHARTYAHTHTHIHTHIYVYMYIPYPKTNRECTVFNHPKVPPSAIAVKISRTREIVSPSKNADIAR